MKKNLYLISFLFLLASFKGSEQASGMFDALAVNKEMT